MLYDNDTSKIYYELPHGMLMEVSSNKGKFKCLHACRHCNLRIPSNNHDPCLGTLKNVVFACCGHGGPANFERTSFDDPERIPEFYSQAYYVNNKREVRRFASTEDMLEFIKNNKNNL